MVKRPLCLAAVLLVSLQAVLVGGFRIVKDLKPSPLELYAEEGKDITLVGTVSRREEKPEYQVYYLTDNQIRLEDQIVNESKILVYIKREKSQIAQNESDIENKVNVESREEPKKSSIAVGNMLSLAGEVRFFQEATNPGNFDQKFYYQKQGIHACVWAESAEIIEPGVWHIREGLTVFRCRWKELLVSCLGEYYGNSMAAILLGDKSGLDQDLKELYQKSGIGHILAISGLHLSFVGIGMYKILRRLTGSYLVGGAFGILFLTLYILMIGLTVSAVRALVMFLFRVGADMAGRHYDAPTALSVSAAVVLLWRPLSLYDGGFWLSFGAVLAVLAVVPVVQKGIFVRTSCKVIWQGVIQGLTASVGINLVILPILLYYFFEFPLYCFILNLFVIPLMSVLLFMGMAGSFLSFAILPLSGICFGVCRKILWLYKISCNLALALPGARFVVGKPEIWQILVYYGILIVVLLLLREKERLMERVYAVYRKADKRCEIGGRKNDSSKYADNELSRDLRRKAIGLRRFALMLGIAGIIILTHRWGERGKLTTAILDVGQGDGIFMKSPEGGTYLVDGGSSDVKKAGQYRIEPFLKSQGVGELDYVLISHGDSDHMNGVEELIERQDIGVKIGTLVLPVQEVWDEALERVAEKAKEYGIHVVVIEPGQSIKEKDMTLTCIQPGNSGTVTENRESGGWNTEEGYEPGNAASMVLAVKFGEFDMLLTGDVEGEGERQLTKQLEEQCRDCTWEILKVPHHGSKNSSSEEFLRQVRPAYALISAGRENRYGHPHQETIERLTDAGSKIYSTQENGAIIIEVRYGKDMKIKKY